MMEISHIAKALILSYSSFKAVSFHITKHKQTCTLKENPQERFHRSRYLLTQAKTNNRVFAYCCLLRDLHQRPL